MGKSFKYPFLFIALTAGIVLGIQIEKIFSGDNLRDGIRKFNDVLTYTEKFYVEEVDTPKLVEEALKGMLDQLDPHSVYISAKQFNSIEESFRGDFEGIGIEFQVVNDTLTVVSPITGGPAATTAVANAGAINAAEALAVHTQWNFSGGVKAAILKLSTSYTLDQTNGSNGQRAIFNISGRN